MAKKVDPKLTRVRKWVTKWQKRLLLQHWNITIVIESIEDDDDYNDGVDVHVTQAKILVNHTYTEATIHVYPVLWEFSLAAQEKIVLHELIHTFLEPMREIMFLACAKKIVTQEDVLNRAETATEQVAKIVAKAYGLEEN